MNIGVETEKIEFKKTTGELKEEENMEMETAMNVLYLSETYEKMSNPNTGLYYQSPGYVYSILDMELKNGKLDGLN